MPDPQELPNPDDLFDDYVRRLDGGDAVDFEAFCAAHPDAAAELRKLEDARLLVERLLPRPLESTPTPSRPGCGTTGVEEPDGSAGASAHGEFDAGTPSELLERLRGPRGRRYEVLDEIARGGMGVVLRVEDTDLRRKLAMKVALVDGKGSGSTDGGMLSRFLGEAQVTSQLDHPGIVPVHEIGIGQDGRVFFTMRLVRGETLRDIFNHVQDGVGGWNQVRALRVIHKVCEAMSYAHEHKVIHRDLKPANIMVGRFGEVYVMDWGLARVLDREDRHDLRFAPQASQSRVETDREAERDRDPDSPLVTLEGRVVGTPAYMSPEQAKGQLEDLGPRSDVYAVGALLYHLISGEVPHVPTGVRMSARTVLNRVIDGPPKSLHKFGRKAPAALVAICEKAMAREIGDRYSDMKALGDELRAYDEGRVVAAYQTGAWAETRMWVRRNRALAVSLVAATLFLAVGVVVLLKFADATVSGERNAERMDAYSTWAAYEELRRQSNRWDFKPTNGETVFTWWRRFAGELIEGAPDPTRPPRKRAGLAECRRLLEELSTNAASSGASRRDEREPFPRQHDLETKRRKLAWYAAMLRLPGSSFQQIDDAVMQARNKGLGWRRLNQMAWHRIDPRAPQYGFEAEGLFHAQASLREATREPEVAFTNVGGRLSVLTGLQHTLAWALYNNGRFAEARAAIRQAEQQQAIAGYPQLEAYVRRWEDGSATLEHAALQREVDLLTQEKSNWGSVRGNDPGTVLWHDQLSELVTALEGLERRLTRHESASDPNHRPHAWPDVIAAIRAEQKYGGLVISPQVDLVPLGPDPVSGLHEFAHLPSGEPPSRNAESTLDLTVATGLVFVLLPGADVQVPDGKPTEPLASVQLDPFFLSKYEMTQAQWQRLSPTRSYAPTFTGPMLAATDLCCAECVEGLDESAGWLRLPTCAQWAYACWGLVSPTGLGGPDHETFLNEVSRGVENPWSEIIPRGRSNQRGFHDMFGGIGELCCDDPTPGSYPARGDGRRGSEFPQAPIQVGLMGGYSSFHPDRPDAAWNWVVGRYQRASGQGLRPARRLMP